MGFKSDIEIAQEAQMKVINEDCGFYWHSG